jgi:hypothetical protein
MEDAMQQQQVVVMEPLERISLSSSTSQVDIFQKLYKCYKAIEIGIRRRKLFDLGHGYYPARQELRRRGWIEIREDGRRHSMSYNKTIIWHCFNLCTLCTLWPFSRYNGPERLSNRHECWNDN